MKVDIAGFGHTLSIIRVKFASADKVLKAVGIQSDGGLYKTVSIAADGTVTASDATTNNITVAPEVDGNAYTAYLAIYPQTKKNLKVVATAQDGTAYSYTISTKESVDYTPGKVYGKTLSFIVNTDNTITPWTESDSSTGTDIAWEDDNNHSYVILDTKDGIRWATTNLGAEAPADYGNYYTWGATSPYSWPSSHDPWSETNTAGHIKDGYYMLPPSNDAATILWGSKWRMPTNNELAVLASYGSQVEISQKDSKGKTVRGFLISSTSSTSTGKTLFLPGAGHYIDDAYYEYFNDDAICWLWSSIETSNGWRDKYAFFLRTNQRAYITENAPSHGLSIRPVYSGN